MQVEEIESVEKGLLQEAQRFFVLAQTDNMWKEHLQVSNFLHDALESLQCRLVHCGYAHKDV
jgi:preprotein translocase subunit SecA